MAKQEDACADKGPVGRVIEFALDHIGLLVTGLLIMWVVLKVLAVWAFQPATAAAILAGSNPTEIILGSLAFLIPVVVLVAAIALILMRELDRRSSRDTSYSRPWAFIVTVSWLLTLVLAMAPLWFSALALLAVLGSLVLAGSYPLDGAPSRWRPILKGLVAWIILAAVLLTLFVGTWISAEALDVEDTQPFVGYVLAVDDPWTALLIEETRKVEYIETNSIRARVVCKESSSIWTDSLLELTGISSLTALPVCDRVIEQLNAERELDG